MISLSTYEEDIEQSMVSVLAKKYKVKTNVAQWRSRLFDKLCESMDIHIVRAEELKIYKEDIERHQGYIRQIQSELSAANKSIGVLLDSTKDKSLTVPFRSKLKRLLAKAGVK